MPLVIHSPGSSGTEKFFFMFSPFCWKVTEGRRHAAKSCDLFKKEIYSVSVGSYRMSVDGGVFSSFSSDHRGGEERKEGRYSDCPISEFEAARANRSWDLEVRRKYFKWPSHRLILISSDHVVSRYMDSLALAAMSRTITLFCWVIHTPTDQIFPLEIGPDKLWGNVKDAIKETQKPEFDDIASKTLKLWKVRHCAVSHVVILNHNSKGHHRSFPTFSLGIRWFLEEGYGQKPAPCHRIFVNGPQRPTAWGSYSHHHC